MKLKEFVSVRFEGGVLDVYERGEHVAHQPFNSNTGSPFRDYDDAMAWLLHYYPDLFTPS